MRKTLSVLLCAALIFAFFPVGAGTVRAEGELGDLPESMYLQPTENVHPAGRRYLSGMATGRKIPAAIPAGLLTEMNTAISSGLRPGLTVSIAEIPLWAISPATVTTASWRLAGITRRP